MAILKSNSDGKVLRSNSGEVLVESGGNSNKILHIDTDLQQVNRIHKDGSNNVIQVTDKVNNIPFITNSDKPSYIYNNGDSYIECDGDAPKKIIYTESLPNGYYIKKPLLQIKFTQIESGYKFLFTSYTAGNDRFELDYYLGNFRVYFNNGLAYGSNNVSLTVGQTYTISVMPVLNGATEQIIFYLDGVQIGAKNFDFTLSHSPAHLSIGDYKDLNFTQGKVGIHYVMLWNDVNTVELEEGRKILESLYAKEPFFYYNRYAEDANKKTYINSRYLKDTIIDSSDNVERIYSEIGINYFEQLTPANQPKWTNKGFLYASGDSLTQASSSDYAYGTGDFTLGRWVDFQANSDVINIGSGAIKIGIDATNIYAETSGGKLYATRANAINEGYKYVCLHRVSGTIYLTIGGVFENSRVESVNYGNQAATIGGTFVGYDDEMLNTHEALWSFSGKSTGQKVFEPPRRRGLDSNFIQH